jgi:hypothetical protein
MEFLLDGCDLDLQCLKNKWLWLQTMNQPWMSTLFGIISFDCGPRLHTFSSIFKHKLFKCIKLVDIACVQILEYVEDEHCFFVMVFMNNKLKICLTCHLDLYICVFLHNDFALLKNFLLKRPSNITRTQRHKIVLMFTSRRLFFEITI